MNKVSLKIILISAILAAAVILPTAKCSANSPPLIMKGDTAYPINSDKIVLESETIKLHYNSVRETYWSKHEVEVIFNFYNTGDETDLDIGFPNVANYEHTLEDFEACDYTSMNPYSTQLKAGGTLPGHYDYYYNTIYTWNMHFNAGEKKSLCVRYKFVGWQGADYILETGALWKDKVGSIDIYVDFPEPAALPEVYASPHNYYYNGKGIEWHFKDVEPDFNLYVSLNSIPSFFKLSDEYYTPSQADLNDSYQWDERFYWINSYFPDGATGHTQFAESSYAIKDIGSTADKLLEACETVRSEILARHGYVFEEAEWREFYGRAPWYKPDLHFTLDSLNSIEKQNMEYIKLFEETVGGGKSRDELIKGFETFNRLYNSSYAGTNMLENYISVNYTDLAPERERLEKNRTANDGLEFLPEGTQIYKTGINDASELEEYDAGKAYPMWGTLYADEEKVILYNGEALVKCENGKMYRLLSYLQAVKRFADEYNSNKGNEICTSPDGKYVVMGNSYNSSFLEDVMGNEIYLVSSESGRSVVIAKGSMNNYGFKWSPSGRMLCFYRKDSGAGNISVFDSYEGVFRTVNLPYSSLTNLEVSDDGSMAVETVGGMYLTGKDGTEQVRIADGGTLLGFSPDGKHLDYCRDSKVYSYIIADNRTLTAADSGTAIWKVAREGQDMYSLYCGNDAFYVYKSGTNELIKYTGINDGVQYRLSPSGKSIYLYNIPYWSELSKKYGTKGSYAFIDDRNGEPRYDSFIDASSHWISDSRLTVLKTGRTSDGKQVLMALYNYSPGTGEKELRYSVKNYKSSLVSKAESSGLMAGYYDEEGEYHGFKVETAGFIINDRTAMYQDYNSSNSSTSLLKKGYMIGVLERGSEWTRIVYMLPFDNLSYPGWIRNSEYSLDADGIQISQGFLYGVKVYEFADKNSGIVLESCSSQAEILNKRRGWLYVRISGIIEGWVREEEMSYRFPGTVSNGQPWDGREEDGESVMAYSNQDEVKTTAKPGNIVLIVAFAAVLASIAVFLLLRRARKRSQ